MPALGAGVPFVVTYGHNEGVLCCEIAAVPSPSRPVDMIPYQDHPQTT